MENSLARTFWGLNGVKRIMLLEYFPVSSVAAGHDGKRSWAPTAVRCVDATGGEKVISEPWWRSILGAKGEVGVRSLGGSDV